MRISRIVGFLFLISIFFNPFPVAGKTGLPEKAYIKGVIGHPQSYILSCESRSAVDYAAFWGVSIRERKFLYELPRSDNPDKGFVGNPNDPWGNTPPKSYGVHAPPVAELLKIYGLQVEARRQMSWSELQLEIAEGRPVIVWVVGQMWPGKARQYQASDRKVVTVAPFEHTMIIVGYSKNSVYAVDAYTGKTLAYSKNAFLKSWSTLGRMAILGYGRAEAKSNPKLINPAKKFSIMIYLPILNR